MTAKEYLKQLRRLDVIINQKLQEVSSLRETATGAPSLDYSTEKVQGGKKGDAGFVRSVERIIELEEIINAQIDEFVAKKHEIIGRIHSLDDPDHITLLFKRYVEFKDFGTIADEMNFAYRYILQLHGEALEEFEKNFQQM